MVCFFGFCLSPLQFLPILGFLLIQFYNCYRSLSGMNKKREITLEVDENESKENIIDALIKANLKAHLTPPDFYKVDKESVENKPLLESSFPSKSYPLLGVPKLFALKALIDWNSNTPNTFLIIKVGATWCPPCRMIAPIYEKMALDMHTKQALVKPKENDKESDEEGDSEVSHSIFNVTAIDVDSDDFNVSSVLPVTSLPTFFLMSKGEVIDSFVGASEAKLSAMFNGIKFE